MASNIDLGKSSIGIDPKVAALLCYLLGWISGLIFLLIEKENKFIKFHALQSIVVFGFFSVLSIVLTLVPVVGWSLLPILYLIELILWIVLMVKGFQGDLFKLPVAGNIAAKNT